MAKTLFRSPGVSTREIDLSAPGQITPQGIPAGVVGTSKTGPAFVPTVFATANEFINKFGDSEAKYFGAIAVKEWMRNARSGLFLRVLGVGNGNKANDAGVTTHAGFFVGDKIRNQSNAGMESDGSAIGRSVNPYAGAALPSKLLTVSAPAEAANAGVVQIDAVAEETPLVFADPNGNGSFATDILDYDGVYIIAQGAPAAAKWLFWLDAQGNRAKVDGGTSTTITDGDFTIATLDHSALGVSHAQIEVINISALSDIYLVAQAIGAAIDGIGGGAVFNVAALNGTSDLTATVVNAVVGAVDDTVLGSSSANVATSVISLGTLVQGVTGVTPVAFVSSAIKFDAAPYDGTSIAIKDHVGATTVTVDIGASADYDVNITGDTTNDAVILKLYNYLTGASELAVGNVNAGLAAGVFGTFDQHGGDTVTDADLQAVMVQAANDASYIYIRESAASASLTKTLPTVTVSESAPQAPGGRTMFLAAQMKPASDSVDLFGSSQTDVETGKKVLRGVVMFASGVMPGLAEEDTAAHESVSPASVAFGEYATGKDEGSHTGYLKDDKFVMILNGFNNSDYSSTLTGSFDPESPVYFAKVLNTDPTKLQERGHYLYAHYDIPSGLASLAGDGNNAFLDAGAFNPHSQAEVIAGTETLDEQFYDAADAYKPTFENWRQKFSHAFTPWITSQTLGNARKKLFRFHMLDAGIGGHNKVKISIANISKSNDSSSAYGSFDVQIRDASDNDKDPIVLEQHVGLSLNPSSDKYIARIIGDQNTFFEFEKDDGKQKLVTEGLYPNRSLYVRVEVVDQVESGQMESSALPIGFQGKHHLVLGGDALANHSIVESPLPFRSSVSTGTGARLSVDSAFYWGAQSQDVRTASERNKETKIVSLISNLTKWFPSSGTHAAWIGDNANAQDINGEGQDANDYNSNEFSLENVWVQCKKNSSGVPDTSLAVDATQWREAVYIRDGNENGYKPYSASLLDSNQSQATDFYQSQEIINDNAAAGSKKSKRASNGWRYLDVSKDFGENASKKYFKFTVPMQGGWDGLDVFDKDKADMSDMSSFREMSSNTSADLGGAQGPTTAAFRKAIDILAEKSDVDIQVLATPGMRSAGITDYAIDKTEDRFDALYIMDMASFDNDQNVVKSDSQYVNVTNTVNEFAGRNLDSSFAAAYFPDVVIQDGQYNVVVPPSCGVLGALSLNDAVSHPWYAPAGQARGALSTVIETAVKLNRSNMDVLYEADINPITSFPNQGDSVMIYGQKTLLQAQSSLDRVNVRRLLIDIRRKVRNVANTILFEPNREATLSRFSSLVNPILGRIQQQNGLDRFKVVIDTTTTTQQDIENNTIRGKIFLQPTRSIEFISLDFVVTNTGAEI